MKTTIDLEISEATLTQAAGKIAEGMFSSGHYGSSTGVGYAALVEAVGAYIKALDFGSIVQEAVTKQMAPVMEEIVREKLKKVGKETLKRMLESVESYPLSRHDGSASDSRPVQGVGQERSDKKEGSVGSVPLPSPRK